jgi:hypothetical protein
MTPPDESKKTNMAREQSRTGVALLQDELADGVAVNHQRLRSTSFPGWNVSQYRHDVGDGFAVPQHAYTHPIPPGRNTPWHGCALQ